MYLKRKYLVIIFISLISFLPAQTGKARKYLVEGNKDYMATSYDEASANYLRSIQEGEDTYKSNFNLGNAMYKLKKYDDALVQYEKSLKLAGSKSEQINAYFNIGDSYYQKRKFDKAAASFKKVLKMNPKDEQARYNYTMAKQKLEEEQKKQEEQKQQNKDKQDQQKDKNQEKSQQDQETTSQNQSGEKTENNEEGKSGGSGNEKSGQGSGQDKGQNSIKNQKLQDNNDISEGTGASQKQYYEGILGAMEEQEKRAQQKIINKRVPPSQSQRGKDW